MTHRPLNQSVHEAGPPEGRETPDNHKQLNSAVIFLFRLEKTINTSLWILRRQRSHSDFLMTFYYK